MALLDGIKQVGVIGAGQMGNGITHVAALSGFEVLLTDANAGQLEKAIGLIDGNLERQVKKEKITADVKTETLARISTVSGLAGLADCDLVIEAATENPDVKIEIFRDLCGSLKKEALIASNTSSISITKLASVTDRPEKFMGMHFMNPVPLMKLVELIRGLATDDATFEVVNAVVEKMGKNVAVSEDYPAFIVNRILLPMVNEAVYALYEGIGTVEAIDSAMKLGANHPMGPLALADFIGLDTCLSIMQVLHDGLSDPKYRPCPLLVKYVEAGWLGRKSGRGFYDYSVEPPAPTR
jgi:3-hydroxybutyryl-CoA dehydrogenase